jgi:hypothetical protein
MELMHVHEQYLRWDRYPYQENVRAVQNRRIGTCLAVVRKLPAGTRRTSPTEDS